METIAVSIGSNLGDRYWHIIQMEKMLTELLLPPIRYSPLMETEPVEVYDDQPWYLNRIITGTFRHGPYELLESTREIERKLGREEKGKKTARTADIDILLFGKEVLDSELLRIPHPSLLSRHFVLKGLRECIPDFSVSLFGQTVEELYNGNLSKFTSQQVRLLQKGGSNEE